MSEDTRNRLGSGRKAKVHFSTAFQVTALWGNRSALEVNQLASKVLAKCNARLLFTLPVFKN